MFFHLLLAVLFPLAHLSVAHYFADWLPMIGARQPSSRASQKALRCQEQFSTVENVACIVIIYKHRMEMQEHSNYLVRLHLSNQPPYVEREKNHLNIAFADSRNRTKATCMAS